MYVWVCVCIYVYVSGVCICLYVCVWGMCMSVYVCLGVGMWMGVQLPQRPEASDPIGNRVTGSYEPLHDIMFEGSTQVLHSSTAYF